MTDKKTPQIVKDIERDVGRDLRAVGGLAKKIFGFTENAQRALTKLAREEEPPKPLESVENRPIARIGTTEVIPRCGVCNDTREVGVQKKIPCPACTKKR